MYSKPIQGEFHVGVLPSRFELALHQVRAARSALLAQRLGKAQEAPTVPEPTFEILTEDLFSLCSTLLGPQSLSRAS